MAECLHPYYDDRDELITQDDLVFKGDLLVILAAMRKEMIAAVHTTHIGVDGCVWRARDTTFWPRMTTELHEYISSKCDICLSYRPLQNKEPLLQHDIHPTFVSSMDACSWLYAITLANILRWKAYSSVIAVVPLRCLRFFLPDMGCQLHWSQTMGHSLHQRNSVFFQKLGVLCISHHHIVIQN